MTWNAESDMYLSGDGNSSVAVSLTDSHWSADDFTDTGKSEPGDARSGLYE